MTVVKVQDDTRGGIWDDMCGGIWDDGSESLG